MGLQAQIEGIVFIIFGLFGVLLFVFTIFMNKVSNKNTTIHLPIKTKKFKNDKLSSYSKASIRYHNDKRITYIFSVRDINLKDKEAEVTYEFTTNQKNFHKLKDYIHKPLSEINIDTMRIQTNDEIHYVLKTLESLCKKEQYIDIEAEIDITINFIREIKLFSDYIEHQVNLKNEQYEEKVVKEFLSKHHILMEQLTDKAKLFNKIIIEKEKKKL